MKITIGHLYPDLLNLYGDRGNIQCLMKRCQWRGIEAETIPFELDDKIDFSKLDIVLLGGGSDREQMIVCEKLQKIQPDFKAYVEDNGVVIAICGGYQLLGKYYKTDQGNMKGLDLVDLYTEQGEGRLIQNIVLQSELFDMPIVGFENHGGRTCINNNKPLGKVLYGAGNDGKSGYEGVVYKNVIGTYLHGPLLPKNPQLADWLIQHTLERKYGKETELTPLDDSQEKSCNQKGKILYLQKMLSETTSQKPVTMQEILAKLEEQGIRAERKSIYDDMETLRDFGMDIHYRRGREGGYYEEKSASDKTEADNTIIHQPDGETGEKSENVQEQIGKESEAPAKISAPIPSQTGENIKEIRLVCQNSTKKKIQRTFGSEIFCKIKGEDNFIVTVEVVVDKAFFGWLTSMGRNVHILKPKKAAVAYRDYLKNIAKDYKGIDK